MESCEFSQYRESDGNWIKYVIAGEFCDICNGAGCYYVGGYYPGSEPDVEGCENCKGLGIIGEVIELGIDEGIDEGIEQSAPQGIAKPVCARCGAELRSTGHCPNCYEGIPF